MISLSNMNLMIVLNKDQVHQVVLIDKENSIILQTIKNMKKKWTTEADANTQ